MNLRDIKQQFWAFLGGQMHISPSVGSDSLNLWANNAVTEMTSINLLFVHDQIACSTGVQEYDLPDDCRAAARVSYSGRVLDLTSQWDLRECDRAWDKISGEPSSYYLNGMNGKIGLYRIPSSDSLMDGQEVVSGGLDLFFWATPPLLEDDADVPALPPWAHPYVVFYMLASAFKMVGIQRAIDSALFWESMFDRGMRRLRYRTVVPVDNRWISGGYQGLGVLHRPAMPRNIPDPGGP